MSKDETGGIFLDIRPFRHGAFGGWGGEAKTGMLLNWDLKPGRCVVSMSFFSMCTVEQKQIRIHCAIFD